ncbi:hypothetical protein CR513_07668, partial [Mucuna pruriens]
NSTLRLNVKKATVFGVLHKHTKIVRTIISCNLSYHVSKNLVETSYAALVMGVELNKGALKGVGGFDTYIEARMRFNKKNKFEGTVRVNRSTLQALRRYFEILEMKVGETIIEYFT